jgi:hypothetical protein
LAKSDARFMSLHNLPEYQKLVAPAAEAPR